VGLDDEVVPSDEPVADPSPVKPKVIELGQIAPSPWWQKWMIEILSLTFITIYSLNFYIGKEQNYKIATNWGLTFSELFREQFAKVGVDAMLVKRTQNAYSMRATGRVNCIGLQAVLKLKRRQDLPSRIYDALVKTEDLLVMDIAMQHMESIVFAVIPKKQAKSYRKQKDIQYFTNPKLNFNFPSFPDNFTILSDSAESAELILTPDIVSTIRDHQQYIQTIHFTDQFTGQYKKVLRFIYKIPPVDKMEDMRVLLLMSLHLIDQLSKLHLSYQTKKKLQTLRSQAQMAAEKEKEDEKKEELEKRQDEKRKKEQEKYEQMTPEQRAKVDQKRARREAKRNQGKVKIVYA